MSFEATLERIANALEKIANGQMSLGPMEQAPQNPPMPESAHVIPMTPQVTTNTAEVTPQQTQAPVTMPPQQQQPPATLPFSDANGLVNYVMASYQALGPEKGGQIQTCLQQLGYDNINQVVPDHYVPLYKAIEGLKAG